MIHQPKTGKQITDIQIKGKKGLSPLYGKGKFIIVEYCKKVGLPYFQFQEKRTPVREGEG